MLQQLHVNATLVINVRLRTKFTVVFSATFRIWDMDAMLFRMQAHATVCTILQKHSWLGNVVAEIEFHLQTPGVPRCVALDDKWGCVSCTCKQADTETYMKTCSNHVLSLIMTANVPGCSVARYSCLGYTFETETDSFMQLQETKLLLFLICEHCQDLLVFILHGGDSDRVVIASKFPDSVLYSFFFYNSKQ